MMSYEWELGKPVQFRLEAELVDDVWTAYSCYIKNNDSVKWFHIATTRTITDGELLNGVYSFVEDFRRDGDSHMEVRTAKFGHCFHMEENGHVQCKQARFTADSTPTLNIDAGLMDSRFYLTTGGYTQNASTQLDDLVQYPEA
jgi:hypothetical protein